MQPATIHRSQELVHIIIGPTGIIPDVFNWTYWYNPWHLYSVVVMGVGVMGVMDVVVIQIIHYEYYIYRRSGHLLSKDKHHLAR